MSSITTRKVCICGAGTMGSGVAQVAAQAGFQTVLYDLNTDVLEKAKKSISQSLQSLVAKGKLTTNQGSEIYDSIQFTGNLKDCIADVIIEAVVEKPGVKIDLFNSLAQLNDPGCIFASNTSSLSVSDIARKINNPARVIGMHFFNPAQIMKLVEVVNTPYTHVDITTAIISLARKMGKSPVVCKDSPGFIVNRVARPYYLEALRLAQEGEVEFEELDTLLEATGFKMGPFKLMDLIGNDINYAVSCSLYEQLNFPERLQPSQIQEKKVKEGKLGKKTSEGYYKY